MYNIIVDKPKKKKIKTVTKLKKEIWVECKRIIRLKYGNKCYTCPNENLEGSNWHTGHGKTNGALSLKYKLDLRNLRPQCYNCNVNLNGMTDIFISKLEREPDGLAFLQEACFKENGYWEIKRMETMGGLQAWAFLNNLLDEYKQM